MKNFYGDARLRAISTRFLGLLSAAALLTGGQVIQAAPLLSANSNSNVGTSTPTQTDITGSVSDEDSGIAPGISAEGRSSASFGVLRTYGSSTTSGLNSSLYTVFSFNSASFRDDFLIDASGLTGTAGSVTVRFMIDGSIATSTSGTPTEQASIASTYALANYTFGVDPGSGPTKQERVWGDGTREGTPFLGIMQEHTLDFTYGTLLGNVTLQIASNSTAAGERFSYASSAIADMEHTATWGGFAAVRDANGNLVNNYSFASSSGFNYVQAVPEPGSCSLILAASAGTVGIRLRRRARSPGAGS